MESSNGMRMYAVWYSLSSAPQWPDALSPQFFSLYFSLVQPFFGAFRSRHRRPFVFRSIGCTKWKSSVPFTELSPALGRKLPAKSPFSVRKFR